MKSRDQSGGTAHWSSNGSTTWQRREARSDLGCGEGRLLRELLNDKASAEISAAGDGRIASRAGDCSKKTSSGGLANDAEGANSPDSWFANYRDKRLTGYDAATVVEVIEHQTRCGWLRLNAGECFSNSRARRPLW